MALVLAIDADWDVVTQYCRVFREQFIFTSFNATWPQHTVHRFIGPQMVKNSINTYLGNNHIHYITGAGHGEYDTFKGYQNQLIWSVNQNLSQLQGAIVHLLACKAGALLGRLMVRQGALAFWGYTENFAFPTTNPLPQDFAQDDVVKPFLQMDCIIDQGILNGQTAAAIYDSITQYVAHIYPHLPSLYEQEVLIDNYVRLVCPVTTWGDANITIG